MATSIIKKINENVMVSKSDFDSTNVSDMWRTSYYIKIGPIVFYYISCVMKNSTNNNFVSVFTFPEEYRPLYGNSNSFGYYKDTTNNAEWEWGVDTNGILKVKNTGTFYLTMQGWFRHNN